MDDEKWSDFEDAVETDDFDFYIISLNLTLPYSPEEQAILEKWLYDPTIFPVQASLLNVAFNKDNSLKSFIETPIKRLLAQ